MFKKKQSPKTNGCHQLFTYKRTTQINTIQQTYNYNTNNQPQQAIFISNLMQKPPYNQIIYKKQIVCKQQTHWKPLQQTIQEKNCNYQYFCKYNQIKSSNNVIPYEETTKNVKPNYQNIKNVVPNDQNAQDLITNDGNAKDLITNDGNAKDLITNDENAKDLITNDENAKDLITNDETINQKISNDFNNMTISNQSFNTSTFSSEEFCEETIPLSLIIGQAGNGKTQIMRKIFDEDVRIQLFKPILQEQLRYYFVDTSSFDFDSDYDSREEQIENYKNLLREYPNRVRSILIVVNFERTDLMKKKVININKYFSKFKNLFTLVITKFNLSEDIQRDKEQLKQSFKFLQAQNIIFVGDDTKKQKLLKDLRAKSLPRLEDGYEFNSVDTLFEEEDEEELKKLQNDLLKKFN